MNTPKRNDNARFNTIQQMMAHTNLCRSSVEKLAKESQSLIRYGRVLRVDVDKFDNYFAREYAE